ncbi:MAG: AMP-binding protein, partial [Actinomycetota bacterium]
SPGPATPGGAHPADLPADVMPLADVLAAGDASPLTDDAIDLLRPDPNDVCEVMFTSGTTGQPKGVLHNQNTINSAADLWLERVAPDCSVFHMASTLAHQTGYLYGIRAPITAGGTIHYQEVWDPTEFAGLIEQHRIQASMGATPFLADLLGVDGLDQRDLSSFAVFVCAGATIPRPVLEEARDRLPCTVMPGWGMTETALTTTARRDDPFEKRATDGAALPGNETRVVDDDGIVVAAGVEGDLQFRGSLGFIGYLQGRDLTRSGFTDDGWFDTGDRATQDADGYITISGRTKDIIIRGGENIPVKDVEDVVLRHPAVTGVALIAKPHDRLGEIGCVVVTVGDGHPAPTLAEVTDFLDTQGVTKQFWPEDLVVVDGFPMTPSGKIQKYQLRQQVLDLS